MFSEIPTNKEHSVSFLEKIAQLDTRPSQENLSCLESYMLAGYKHDKKYIERVRGLDELIPGLKTEGLVSLDTLSEEPKREKYDARALYGSDQDTPYVNTLFAEVCKLVNNDLEKIEWLRKKFEESVIIDIGAGSDSTGYLLSAMLGARGYIGVEPFRWDNLAKRMSGSLSDDWLWKQWRGEALKKVSGGKLPFFNLAFEDGLSFLKRVPSGKVSLLSSGIIVNDRIIDDQGYADDLQIEMERVMGQDSFVIIGNSSVAPRWKNKPEVVCELGSSRYDTIGEIYRKSQ